MKFTDEGLHQQAIAAAKSKFKIWPSAYGSAWMTRHYRQIYKAKKGRSGGAFKGRSDSLKEWFAEDWKAINSSGKIVGGCGDGETKGKVKCLPASKARSLSKSDRSTLAKRKQVKDPKPSRSGSPVMVSSKLDAMDPTVLARAIASIEQKYGLRIDSTSTVEKWIIWLAGRNTGAVVHATSRSGAISRARAKKVTGWEGKVDAARLCNDRELAMIKKGTWIRTRANGKETGGAYKFRSWLKS